jgi:hypothetical protein
VFAPVLMLVLALVTATVPVSSWRAPLDSRWFRVPDYWPWSTGIWLGLRAGDIIGPLFFLFGGLMMLTSGVVSDVMMSLFSVVFVLLATLFLFGQPSVLMQPALRGVFRGAWRRPASPVGVAE